MLVSKKATNLRTKKKKGEYFDTLEAESTWPAASCGSQRNLWERQGGRRTVKRRKGSAFEEGERGGKVGEGLGRTPGLVGAALAMDNMLKPAVPRQLSPDWKKGSSKGLFFCMPLWPWISTIQHRAAEGVRRRSAGRRRGSAGDEQGGGGMGRLAAWRAAAGGGGGGTLGARRAAAGAKF